MAICLALAGGGLTALSLPPWGAWPLAFAGVAMFDVAARSMATRRGRCAAAFAFTIAWMLPGMAWMWFLTAPGYLVAVGTFGAYHVAAELLVPARRWQLVGRPAAHALAEAVRCSFPFGGVPLATLGIAQASGPFVSLARIGGVIALSWFVLQTGSVLGAVIARRTGTHGAPAASGPRRSRWGPDVIAATGSLVVFALSALAPHGEATGRSIRIGLVQGGGVQGTRALDVPARIVTDRHLEETAQIDSGDGVDVVIWPENVIDVEDFETSTVLAEVAAEARRLDAPFAVGVTEDVPGRPGRITNAQVLVARDGRVVDRYDKVRRVPFGEYVPLRALLSALGLPVDQVPTNAVAGTGPAVLDLPPARVAGSERTRVAVAISWEVFFPGRVREGVRAGGLAVVNPTNGASYTWTILQSQQIASSRLRAIETGRWVVQVAPTGFSAVVDHHGDVVARTGVSEAAVIIHDVGLRSGRTLYVSMGDRPWYAALVAVLCAAHLLPLAARRRPVGPVADVTAPASGSSGRR